MIGVFDSGVGGLTVLKSLANALNTEEFLYVGDTARLPYGNKSPETIQKYTQEIMSFLKEQNASAIIIACNSASSQFKLSNFEGIPVYNVIDPGAALAIKKSKNKKIGVIGTKATVESKSYDNKLISLSQEVQVYSQACPLFVSLAEEAWVDDPLTNLVCYRYLQPLLHQEIDTLILGCTHYPLLSSAIQKVIGTQVQLVDSGQALSEILTHDIQSEKIPSDQKKQAQISVGFTDPSKHSLKWAQEIMEPIPINEFLHIKL